ncbi:hypothetical protein FHS22_001221 [Planomonospora venezuelensis]|uniref:Uncharacterized protein n=1 Tax=Planomonospora venezuelensis TaxID=1999 RepID=A0A841CU76_PLAVE|nr:hypothetical protein [Planomonospora venezuelensis]
MERPLSVHGGSLVRPPPRGTPLKPESVIGSLVPPSRHEEVRSKMSTLMTRSHAGRQTA